MPIDKLTDASLVPQENSADAVKAARDWHHGSFG
jgi:hypothetical protein